MTSQVVIDENRDFKGVWLPKELYLNNNLTWNEKIILVEIDSLSKNGECFASNQHFANLLGISKKRVESIISELRKNKYITSTIIYKKDTKEVEKRILRVADPYTFSNNITLPSKIRVGILENEGTPPLKNEGDKNTYIKNTKEEYTNIDNKECNSQVNCTNITNIEEKAGKWEWKSDKAYVDYIESVLPKIIAEISSDYGNRSDNAYKVFLEITTYFFEQYRIFNNKYHVWYRKDTLEECYSNLFDQFGAISVSDIKEYIDVFFEHKKMRNKPFKVFCSCNMLETLAHEINQDWQEEYYNN